MKMTHQSLNMKGRHTRKSIRFDAVFGQFGTEVVPTKVGTGFILSISETQAVLVTNTHTTKIKEDEFEKYGKEKGTTKLEPDQSARATMIVLYHDVKHSSSDDKIDSWSNRKNRIPDLKKTTTRIRLYTKQQKDTSDHGSLQSS